MKGQPVNTDGKGERLERTSGGGGRAVRAGLLVSAAAALVLGAAACGSGRASPGVASLTTAGTSSGSSGPKSTATSTAPGASSRLPADLTARLLRFSQCMRSHGVSDFPDLTIPSSRPGRTSYLGDGPNPSSSPAYEAASTACRKYAVASPVTPAAAARVEAEQLEHARCMRAHRVPDFSDPGADGGSTIQSSIDQNGPVFQAAERTCERYLPGLAGPPGTSR
jgi:hypothetical protein